MGRVKFPYQKQVVVVGYMRCRDFRTLYSDFRDALIVDPAMNQRMRRHMAQCRSCARHHEAIELGTEVLRELDPIEPSERFLVSLRCKIALTGRRLRAAPVFGWPASAAATMLVALVIAKGVYDRGRTDAAAQASEPEQPVAQVARPSPPTTAVRTRFEPSWQPTFRASPVQFTPSHLDLDSALESWPRADSGTNFVTVQASFSR